MRLTTLPPSCTECLEIWNSQRPGILRACPGLYRDCFTFFLLKIRNLDDQRNIELDLYNNSIWDFVTGVPICMIVGPNNTRESQ
jgi:hypothetical protein